MILPRELSAAVLVGPPAVPASGTVIVDVMIENRFALAGSRYPIHAMVELDEGPSHQTAVASGTIEIADDPPTLAENRWLLWSCALALVCWWSVLVIASRNRRSSARDGVPAFEPRRSAQLGTDALVLIVSIAFLASYFPQRLLLSPTTTAGGDMASHVYSAVYLREVLLPAGQVSGWSRATTVAFRSSSSISRSPSWRWRRRRSSYPCLSLSSLAPCSVRFFFRSGRTSACAWPDLRFPGGARCALHAGVSVHRLELRVGREPALDTLRRVCLLARASAGHSRPRFHPSRSGPWGRRGAARGLGRRGRLRPRLSAALARDDDSCLAGVAPLLDRAAGGANGDSRPRLPLARSLARPAAVVFALDHALCRCLGLSRVDRAAPPILWPAAAGVAGAVVLRALSPRLRDPGATTVARIWWAAMPAATALYLLAPALGVVNIRFLPFLQVALGLVAAVEIGGVLSRMRAPETWPIAVLLALLPWLAARQSYVPAWIEWNYSGFEAKPGWSQLQRLSEHLRGDFRDPRVVFEHSPDHEALGTTRAFENLPLLSGRSTLEGLYMQASPVAPFVFFVQSELSRRPCAPSRRGGAQASISTAPSPIYACSRSHR